MDSIEQPPAARLWPTPRPWEVLAVTDCTVEEMVEASRQAWKVSAGATFYMVTIPRSFVSDPVVAVALVGNGPAAAANAELIVRAVNKHNQLTQSHASLLNALKERNGLIEEQSLALSHARATLDAGVIPPEQLAAIMERTIRSWLLERMGVSMISLPERQMALAKYLAEALLREGRITYAAPPSTEE